MEILYVVLILGLFSAFYGLVLYSFIKRLNTHFLSLLLVFVVFYDFIFINLSFVIGAGPLYIAKSWMEYGFIALGIYYMVVIFRDGFVVKFSRDKGLFIILLGLSVIGVVASILGGNSFSKTILGWRSYVLPIFLFLGLAEGGYLNNLNLKKLNQVILIACFFVTVGTFYQFYTFNGSLSDLWHYSFFELNPDTSLDLSDYNFLREGSLRATGLYVSPLINSMVLGFFALFITGNLFFTNGWQKKALYAGLLLVVLYALYLSNTRIGFAMLAVGLAAALFYFAFNYKSFIVIFMVPFLAVLLTVLMLVLGFVTDLSALGRLVQYAEFINNFKLTGLGFGHERVNIYYDSWYISILLLFGVFSVVYFGFQMYLIKRLHQSNIKQLLSVLSEKQKVFYFASYSYSFSVIFIFAFQYTTGGPALLLFYFFNFLVYSDIVCKAKTAV